MTTVPPAYMALAASLRSDIEQGRYAEGERLPTEAELVAESGLSRQTVRRAYLELTTAGVVERVPGRGTFVRSSAQERYARGFDSVLDLMGFSIDTHVEVVRPLARRVDIAAAARLGLDQDAVYELEYVRSHRGAPFAVTTVALPPEIAERASAVDALASLSTDDSMTVIGLLESSLGIRLASAEQTITAEPADAHVARTLATDEGAAVLRIDRVFLDGSDQPVELSIGRFLPSQYTHRSRLRRA